MSSMDVQGNNNRTSGRDYYENCQWNLHVHAAAGAGGWPPGGGEPPQDPPSLEQLLKLLPEARRDALRKRIRRIFNRPTMVCFGMFGLALVALFSMLGGLGAYLDAPWVLSVPMALIVAGSMYWNRSLSQVRAIHEASVQAQRYLEAVEMEIARQKEAKRQEKVGR